MTQKKSKIGEMLVASGIIRDEQVREAVRAQEKGGGTIGEHLVRLGYVGEEALLNALSEQTGLRHINLAKVEVPPSIQRLVKFETVQKRRLLPIGFEGKRLVVGMVDPTDAAALADVEFQSGHGAYPVVLSASQYEQAMAAFEAQGYGSKPLKVPAAKPARGKGEGSLASLLKALVSWKGQDLHVSAGAVPSVRVDGEMWRLAIAAMKPAEVEQIVREILTPEQRRTLEERGEIDFAYSLEGVGRFRCGTYRQRGTVSFTARHVADVIPSAADLGLPDFLREAVLRRQGLVLVTGPGGQGKTTTLASLVDVVNRERKANVITVEDPIEFTHRHRSSNVNQREVGTDTPSTAAGLRNILRQNPDVVVIGDLRDAESIGIALGAAESGRLVLAATPAQCATAAVERIVDAFPAERHPQARAQLAEALVLVFAQRLLRKSSGAGRVLAWEKLGASLRVRNAIREGKVRMLRGMMQASAEELVGIDWNLAELVAAGTVRYDEALKHAESAATLNELLKVRGAYR